MKKKFIIEKLKCLGKKNRIIALYVSANNNDILSLYISCVSTFIQCLFITFYMNMGSISHQEECSG